ncbi:MAG: Lrp/AsnC family transcriptional regulator [Bacteroidales bacterium]|jgi:Lrp/AsnC family leucine-responsive transcriptional regulator|nr:Lrp/AsnC family transcriptional regulator [Bacteroidales bacterium]MBP5419780.1 Lrp/AsnC family transcriptional regulator [Bacteroidales bacterium]MCR5696141.1 Lrp/AsnC family transcriptional regulator [Marinilabiliaceae bacterium]
MKYTLDEIDLTILRKMQENCRLTVKELAQKIHLSPTPTFERLRKLERNGFIKQYSAILDAEKLNRGFMVICCISTKNINKVITDNFRQKVQEWNEVSECYNTSGEYDFMMKVYVNGMKEYQEFILNKVGVLDYISKVQSIFIMDSMKDCYGIPV